MISAISTRRLVRPAFTLLEMTVALVISAILMVSVFSSFYVAFKARDSAERAVRPLQAAQVAMQLLQTDLEAAQAPGGLLAQSFEGTNLQGNGGNRADDLVFFTTSDAPTINPPHQDGVGDIKQVELVAYQPDGSRDQVLVRRVTSNLLSPNVLDPDEEVIARHVTMFMLRYFDGQQWQDEWDSTQYQNVLPSAVEVTLEIKDPQAPANAPPIHVRRIFPLSCVGPPNIGTAGSSSSNSSSNSSSGKSSSSGGTR